GYLANGAEPWLLPDVTTLPTIDPAFATGPNHVEADGAETFQPYKRDPASLARPWAVPGTPGLMHRVGGIEKADGSGNISYDPRNHEKMVHLRADKVAGIARDYPATEVDGDDDAAVLVLGWGSTWGAIGAAVKQLRADGHKVARCHLTHLFPLPADLGDVLRRFERVLVPEMNLGQLSRLVRAEYLVDATAISKVQGLPFTGGEIEAHLIDALTALEPAGAVGEALSRTHARLATTPAPPAGVTLAVAGGNEADEEEEA
ncbi:MAG: 2-oxoglutarate ferredoxin oxidoreductase subunit alpha, partial [Geodermatophilaceae bacterium]|nr:2-oxoglutarate ferredoxin oxidoreductase subunit alpha [Geodermatophilaceae bacterium]